MRRPLAILTLSVVMAGLAGCSASPPPPVAAPGTPTPSASQWWLPPTGPPPTLTVPSPSPPPCEPDQGWSADQQTSWLRGAASASLASSVAGSAGVTVSSSHRVCQPIPVQVEYFVLTWDSGLLKATSVSHTTIQADGSAASVPPPAQVANRDGCTGAIVVVYTGDPPLGDAELPLKFDTYTNLSDEGWAKRVAVHSYAGPRHAPPNCTAS